MCIAPFRFVQHWSSNCRFFFNIRLKRLIGTTLLVDRYIYDNIVTYAANLGLGDEYMRKTMEGKWKHAPRPDRIIYIKTPVEVCCSRKDDIPDPLYLEIRKPLYEKVADMYGAKVVAGESMTSADAGRGHGAVDECAQDSTRSTQAYWDKETHMVEN